MPPDEAGWKLSVEDFNIIKMWISQGARDEEGKTYLNAKEINQLLPPDQQNTRLYYKPTFDDTYFRYLSGYDFFTSIKSFVPNYPDGFYVSDLRALGFKNPATGAPYISSPNAATIGAISKGIQDHVNFFIDNLDSNLFGIAFDQKTNPWKSLDDKKQVEILNKIVDYLIGPQVMNSKQQEKIISLIKNKISDEKNKNISTVEVLKKALFLIISSERFQTL